MDALIAGPSSTWQRAGSAGSPGTRGAGAAGVSAETPAAPRPGPAARRGHRCRRAPRPGRSRRHRRRPPWRPGTTPRPRPGRRPGPRRSATAPRRRRPRRAFRGGGRFRGNAPRGSRQVGAGGAQRLQQHRARQRREAERAGQGAVLLEPPGQPAADPGVRVIGRGDLPVRPGEPLQLVPRHRPGHLGQARLGRRGGDPGQRPDLGVGQPGRGELGPGSPAGPAGRGPPGRAPGPCRRTSGTSTTATAAQLVISQLAQPRRASKSASRTRNRHVAAARCPASSQICASSRSSGTPGGADRGRGDVGWRRGGGEDRARLAISNMYLTIAARSDKAGDAGRGRLRG